MRNMILVLLVFAPALSMASVECPKKIAVEVTGLVSTSADNQDDVDDIFVRGESQTPISFIKAVLQAVNKISTFKDTLILEKENKTMGTVVENCFYKGNKSTLILVPKRLLSDTAKAGLNIGYVNYKNPDPHEGLTSAKGYQAQLVAKLTAMDAKAVTAYKNQKPKLNLNLEIQVPLGDYGTDGYGVDVQIGQADSITFKILK